MIQKINILDSSQSGVKNGADSEAVLAALIEHLELINPSGRLSQNTRSAMLQLREEEWSEFFFWLLNSLECLDYVIINLTPESKKTLMSEHRNNIQVAIDALYSQRRRKSPGDESETEILSFLVDKVRFCSSHGMCAVKRIVETKLCYPPMKNPVVLPG